jgi:mRNA interferase RelE/StbE
MSPYKIELKPSAQRELKKLPKRLQRRIVNKIDLLADDPRPSGAEKLSGGYDYYRIRVGDYRILYEIQDKVLLVIVIRVAHRKEVYHRFRP